MRSNMMINKTKTYFHTKTVKIYDNSIYHKNQNNRKHLTVIIISNDFINQPLLIRHQKIYKFFFKILKEDIYALSIHAYTVEESKKKNLFEQIECYNK